MFADLRHHERAAQGKQFAPQFFGQCGTFGRVVIGDGDDFGSHFRHIPGHKTMDDRQRKNIGL